MENKTEEGKVIEGNKLIAEFMGAKCHKGVGDLKKFTYAKFPDTSEKCGGTYNINTLRYHSDWRELMPVLDEIEARRFDITIIGYLKIENGESEFVKLCFIQSGQKFVAETEGDSKIEVVYTAVVQFIQWYNTQTSQTK